jgi:D-beta-D-heptose 7-phosphate kinase/D-beta-D-heptose 1-phosphate adenosyltransferase
MARASNTLLSIIDRFHDTPITVIGDLILDAYIWGRVNRISPEAPVVVVEVTEESKRPGGAGNVATNLAALGAKTSVLGLVGDDSSGRELLAALTAAGADVGGVIFETDRPTSVKTRVIAHSQQVVRVDREVVTPISNNSSKQLVTALQNGLGKTKGIIVSDYGKGTVQELLFSCLSQWKTKEAGRAANVPVLVDPKSPNFAMYRGSTVIKPNRKEAEEASGIRIKSRADAVRAGKMLRTGWGCEMVLITLGEDGMVLISSTSGADQVVEIDTVAREIYDVSGAGDTVSAVFTLALATGAAPRDAARLANIAAGIVVGEVGTVAVSAAKLRDAVQSGGEV